MRNELLRLARERLPSPARPGEPMSRQEFASAVNQVLSPGGSGAVRSPFNANYVGKLENGTIGRPDRSDYRAAIRVVTGVRTDEELGFFDPRHHDRATVDDVNRRGVLTNLGVTVGGVVLGEPIRTLLAPTSSGELPRRVSRENIAEIIEAADIFEHWDNSHGGAVAREIADDKLRKLAKLLTVDCPSTLRRDLHTALAHLSGVVAFMLFDAYEHDAARNRFLFGLQRAEVGGNWHQRAMLLSSMARQAIWCGQADDGLTYVEMGLVRADRLTSTELAMMHTVRARALAKLGPGRAQEALKAVGAADEAFAHAKPVEDPPWMRFYDDAQHRGDTAHALYDVAMHTALETEADSRFRYSVQHHEPEFARSRAISRTKLASLTMAKGDPREAAAIGQVALNDAGAVRSLRAADDLRTLHRLSAPHASIADVTALRERIDATVGAAA